MRSVPAGQFKQHCLRILDEVAESGEAVVVAKRGRPVARLVAAEPASRAEWRNAMAGTARIEGDLVEPATDPDDWDALRP